MILDTCNQNSSKKFFCAAAPTAGVRGAGEGPALTKIAGAHFVLVLENYFLKIL